jgi:hypothetical protein
MRDDGRHVGSGFKLPFFAALRRLPDRRASMHMDRFLRFTSSP